MSKYLRFEMQGKDMNTTCICRLCLGENVQLIHVFESKGVPGWTAANVIDELLRIEVSEGDIYPKFICTECMGRLVDFKQFKHQCEVNKDSLDLEYRRNHEVGSNEITAISAMSTMASVNKRKKNPNMTGQEKDLLVDLVERHYNVIENKRTDKVTSLRKTDVWRKVTQTYNSQGLGPARCPMSLRNAWENFKKAARRAVADARSNGIETGGGPSKMMKIDPFLERVIGIIRLSKGGGLLCNPLDADSEEKHSIAVEENVECGLEEEFVTAEVSNNPDAAIEITTVHGDWVHYAPKTLKQHAHQALQTATAPSCSSAQQHGSTESASASSTHSWSRCRSSPTDAMEKGNGLQRDKKVEALDISTTLSLKDHQWNTESEEMSLERGKLRVEQEKLTLKSDLVRLKLNRVRLEREKMLLAQEKVKLERENELLKQDKIRTELLMKELNK